MTYKELITFLEKHPGHANTDVTICIDEQLYKIGDVVFCTDLALEDVLFNQPILLIEDF